MTLLAIYFVVAIVLDHAHLACPILVGWSNPGFRNYMLTRPEKFILLPAVCVVVPVMVGATALTTHDPAFRTVALIYLYWNAYHFAAQNYGICALSGGTARHRIAAFALTALLMLPPIFADTYVVVFAGLGIDLMHWIMDIRLSGFVVKRQVLFTAAVLCIGMAGFMWKSVSNGPHCGVLPICTVVRSMPLLLSIRYGLGFVHFLFSRWVWKLSDPQVRAMIGRELFA